MSEILRSDIAALFGQKFLYRPIYRPMHSVRLPSDVTWDYVEAPNLEPMIAVRRGLPLSRHTHGIIATSRALTEYEREQYGLEVYS
jgi:hypothetical protein